MTTKSKGGRPPDPTNSARQLAYKARQKAKGLIEVRGIYAPKEDHKLIKMYAQSLKRLKMQL